MTRRFFLLGGALLLAILYSPAARTLERGEKEKILYMIEAVERMEGALFIRNGKEYDGRRAADHLRRKWKAAGDRVKTAEDFIRLCASFSTLSGQPYRIRFADGTVTEAGPYFRRLLSSFPFGTAP